MYILHVHVYSQYGIRAVDNCETEGNCSFRSGRTIKGSLAAAANVMNSRFIQIWIDVHTVTLFASVNHECGPRLWVDWSSARTPHACLLIPVHNVKSACMAFDGYVCYRRKAVHLNKYVNKGFQQLVVGFFLVFCFLFFFFRGGLSFILMIFPAIETNARYFLQSWFIYTCTCIDKIVTYSLL